MRNLKNSISTLFLCLITIWVCGQGITLSDYKVSWVGNTFKGEPGWVPHDVEDIFVTPDGTVYTNTTWEENRNNVIELKDGNYINGICPFAGEGGGSVPRRTGEAVTANEAYVFYASSPEPGIHGSLISRRVRDGLGPHHISKSAVERIRGLAASETHVYAACNDNKIRKFTVDLQDVDSWSVESPRKITLDHEGKLWVISGDHKILRFDTDGTKLPQEIHLPPHVVPLDIASMRTDGRLLITDAGINEQILIYKDITTQPEFDTTFGAQGGVLAGPRPGIVGTMRFSRPIGVGSDDQGNIYVANGSPSGGPFGSSLIQSYTLQGELNWRVMAQEWIDCADMDPYSTVDLYSKSTRYDMDFTQGVGKEWELRSLTIDRHKYPDDPRLHGAIGGVTYRVLDGHKFLFMNDMGGIQHIFRFDGEITVPCGRVSPRDIWIDSNGNGIEEPHEVTSINLGGSRGWWTDEEGTIWAAQIGGQNIYKFPLQKIDGNGVPVYTHESMVTFDNPGPLTELRRIRYYPDEDVLYLGGGTDTDGVQHWKPMGPNLVRYDNWHTSPTMTFHKVLPYEGASGDVHMTHEPHGIDVAGDYIFAVFVGDLPGYNVRRGTVMVLDKATGDSIGLLETPLDFAQAHLGIMDICQAIRAYHRPNGEYIVIIEEDGRSKLTMFRWCPSGECEEKGHVAIATPTMSERYGLEDAIYAEVKAISPEGVSHVNVFVDDSLAASLSEYPYETELQFDVDGDYYISSEMITNNGDTLHSNSVKIFAYNPKASQLEIKPSYSMIQTNDFIQFSFEAHDQFGFRFYDPPDWAVDGEGEISTNGLFTAGPNPGLTNVIAQSGETSDTAEVLVYIPELQSIKISPHNPIMYTNNTLEFTAVGYDQNEEPININPAWEVIGDAGTIDSETGIFVAGNVEDTSQIVAFEGEVSDTVKVTIITPSSWINMDVGNVCVEGSMTFGNNIYTIESGGSDIWGNNDEFHFAFRLLAGDGEISAKLNAMQASNLDEWAKAGVMIRESLAAGSKHAMMALTGAQGAAFQFRQQTSGSSSHREGDNKYPPYWVKLSRNGDVLSGYISEDGLNWNQVSETEIAMNDTVLIGLSATSHDNCQIMTTEFTNVVSDGFDIIEVTNINLSESNITLHVSETHTLVATTEPPNTFFNTIEWQSENPSVATVSNGVIEAKAAGNTVITAFNEFSNISAQSNITVIDTTSVSINSLNTQHGISIYPNPVGSEKTLTIMINDKEMIAKGYEIIISDMTGRIVSHTIVNPASTREIKMDVSNFRQKGILTVSVLGKNKKTSKYVIIM